MGCARVRESVPRDERFRVGVTNEHAQTCTWRSGGWTALGECNCGAIPDKQVALKAKPRECKRLTKCGLIWNKLCCGIWRVEP